MTVHGISTVTGKPFVMTLAAGGTAEVKIELASAGRFTVDTGPWWIAPNGRFCIHYTRFAGGNRVCRELVVEDGVPGCSRNKGAVFLGLRGCGVEWSLLGHSGRRWILVRDGSVANDPKREYAL
jgi:hypothetical protein